MSKLFILLAILSYSLSIGQKPVDYLPKILTQQEFILLQNKPLLKKYGDIKSVKILLDVKTKKVYYINGKLYELHYDFSYHFLKYRLALPAYNEQNYSDDDRRFCLVNLNYFPKVNKYVLEYNVSDDISYTNIKNFYKYFQHSFFDSLQLVLNNNDRLDWKSDFEKDKIPIILPAELFSAQKIQIVNEGEANGELVYIEKKDDLFKIPLKDKIVLLGTDVLEMPDCKGIITNIYQTPLSHISLLAKNRGIPVLVNTEIFKDSAVFFLVGQNACLNITEDNYTLKSCIQKNTEKKHKEIIQLEFDLSQIELLTLKDISLKNKNQFGTKCSNVAELGRIKGKKYEIPEGGFGIPFYYYDEHLKTNGIKEFISNFLNDTTWKNDRNYLKEQLELIRDRIISAPINKFFLKMVIKNMDTLISKNYRFRSSSNAEDLNGFNGAGLYDSKTGIFGDTTKSIEEAIKKVWASVWTLRAFEEREIFNIDQSTVFMGILSHRSFPDEVMNGVAITANLYRDYNAGFILNQQVGENRVVDNTKFIPEQLISYFNSRSDFFDEKNAVEYISTSSLNDFKPILTTDEVMFVTKELERIKRYFYPKLNGKFYKDFALDIEYKFAYNRKKEKKLYIKQVRLLSKD